MPKPHTADLIYALRSLADGQDDELGTMLMLAAKRLQDQQSLLQDCYATLRGLHDNLARYFTSTD